MIPAAPRLHPRCRLIPDPPGVTIRMDGTYLRVRDRDRAERVRTIAGLMDGRPAGAVLSSFGLEHLREGMRILEELHEAGALVEHDTPLEALPELPAVAALDDAHVRVIGAGPAAAVLERELSLAGARLSGDGLAIICPDGPDIALFEQFNAHARSAWMPALRLGDELIAGPRIEPGQPGCFACFILRWAGMAASIPAEMAYLRFLREGGWEQERLSPGEASLLARHTIHATAAMLHGNTPRDAVSFTNLRTGQTSRVSLLPHPGCTHCRPPAHASDAWAGWRTAVPGEPLVELERRLEEVVDDRIGLIGRLAPVEAAPSMRVPLVAEAGQFALPSVEGVTRDTPPICAGLQSTRKMARLVAIVEGMERYCGLFPLEAAVQAPYRDVAGQAMLPTTLPLFSEAQYAQPNFPFRPFTADQPIAWVHGYSLTHDRPVLVPRCVASYGPPGGDLVDECSSGVAARTSLGEAVLRGMFEMVERDAFMITWLNRLSPPLIDLDALPAGFARSAVEELRALRHEAYAVNLTTDLGIPAFLVIAAQRDGSSPALTAGAGCAFDPVEALDKAFQESLSAVSWRVADSTWKLKPPMHPDEVRSLDDHSRAYSHPDWLARAEFLWSSPKRDRLQDLANPAAGIVRPGEQLARAVELLQGHGHEFIAVDLTTPDVARTGIRVARAVIPGLQPIGFGRYASRLGGERLFSAPRRMGYGRVPLSEHEINPDPHCFP